MQNSKKQNYLKGAAILAAASILAKVFSAVYKILIFSFLEDDGAGYFTVTYNVYALLLTISSVGIPVALSRLISTAAETDRTKLVQRYFSVGMSIFCVIGGACAAAMLIFADGIASVYKASNAAAGIRVLAPAVFFACVVSVYRGYAQGHKNMMPTAISQVVEVVCKAAFGVAIAWWLNSIGAMQNIVSAGAILGVTIGLGLAIPLLMLYKRRHDKTLAGNTREDRNLPSRGATLKQILKVSVPITLGSLFISILTNVDMGVVLRRLQDGLGLAEDVAMAQYGIYGKSLSIYNVPTALIVPVAVSIIPAIASAIVTGRRREAQGIMQSSVKIVNLLAMPAGVGIMVLSKPIYMAVYGRVGRTETIILAILGAASFFMCLQLITTALLQANGHEKVSLLTFPIGGALMVGLDYILVGNPNIGIIGSPIGTLTCYAVISALNIAFIIARVKERPKFLSVFLKPLLCTALMGLAAYASYGLISKALIPRLGEERTATIIYLGGAVCIAVIVYAVLIIATKTVTREDIKLLPGGEKLADKLKLR